jgi:hypothetical protein
MLLLDVFELTGTPGEIRTRGFYIQNDGGEGVWVATGDTDISRAGMHFITEARIYNAAGIEYQLKVDAGSKINPKSTGHKRLRHMTKRSLILTILFVWGRRLTVFTLLCPCFIRQKIP